MLGISITEAVTDDDCTQASAHFSINLTLKGKQNPTIKILPLLSRQSQDDDISHVNVTQTELNSVHHQDVMPERPFCTVYHGGNLIFIKRAFSSLLGDKDSSFALDGRKTCTVFLV